MIEVAHPESARLAEISTQLQNLNSERHRLEYAIHLRDRALLLRREGETGVRVSCSDDGAIVRAGDLCLYYGYEHTLCPRHGTEQVECECEDREWCFVVTVGRDEVFRKSASELHSAQNRFDVVGALLCGIGLWLRSKEGK